MKQLYASFLFSLLLSVPAFAAPRFWVGGASGNWNVAANWSATSGGAGGASVPGSSDDVTFNTNAVVNVNLASVTVNSLLVTNNVTIKLFTTANTVFTVNSGAALTPGLQVDAGSRLSDSTDADVDFNFVFNGGTSAIGTINGTWTFGAKLPISAATVGVGVQTQNSTAITINGAIIFYPNSGIIDDQSGSSLAFNAGSSYNLACDGGLVPQHATWNTTSTINVTGSVSALPAFFGAPPSYGNVIINVPNLNSDNTLFQANGTTIKGDLQIANTNNNRVTLVGNIGTSPFSLNINGSLQVSGSNTIAVLATDDGLGSGNQYTVNIGQDFSLSNATFSLQDDNAATGTSTLKIARNFSQTGGTFTAASTAANASSNLFIVELNGSAAQTFSTSTGTINNAQNMVALRLKNTSGGVTLNSPLTVGRIDFVSGVLSTTSTNLLTIDDPSNNAIVVNNPSATSYINGPLKRHMNTTGTYRLPTGKGINYHYCEVIPSSTNSTYYTAEYFNIGFGVYTVITPLANVSHAEYWNIAKNSGDNAVIQLSLIGVAVPGSIAVDSITVARYDGAEWLSERGNAAGVIAIKPGNSTTGTTFSQLQTTYGNYTFGFAPTDALPIRLLSFNAQKINVSNAKLDWQTDITSTAASFDILKSSDGATFSKVGSVSAVVGSTKYTYTDRLQPGTNYYRLRMFDRDGSVSLSKIVAIINKEDGVEITSLVPTLVHDKAKLEIAAARGGNLELYVTDMIGRTWRKLGVTVAAGNTDVMLDFNDLGSGVYQITGYMDGNKTSSIRFVKQ